MSDACYKNLHALINNNSWGLKLKSNIHLFKSAYVDTSANTHGCKQSAISFKAFNLQLHN